MSSLPTHVAAFECVEVNPDAMYCIYKMHDMAFTVLGIIGEGDSCIRVVSYCYNLIRNEWFVTPMDFDSIFWSTKINVDLATGSIKSAGVAHGDRVDIEVLDHHWGNLEFSKDSVKDSDLCAIIHSPNQEPGFSLGDIYH